MRYWIQHGLLRQSDIRVFGNGLRIDVEDQPVHDVVWWLQKYERRNEVSEAAIEFADRQRLEKALEWRQGILKNQSVLAESIGKAAARIWMYEKLANPEILLGCFLMGLKYYGKRENRAHSNQVDIKELVATEFRTISEWAGNSNGLIIAKSNLGMAYFAFLK